MFNMISLNEYIKESLLDDEDVLLKDTSDDAIKEMINNFLKDNYKGVCKISKKPINGKYIVDCNGDLIVKNKNITSLTNVYFEFGFVGRDFYCPFCTSLTSLKGAPEKVDGNFSCFDCKSLTSLESAPKEVGENFDCSGCSSLTSLKGAPKEVGEAFYCVGCKTKFSKKRCGKSIQCKR